MSWSRSWPARTPGGSALLQPTTIANVSSNGSRHGFEVEDCLVMLRSNPAGGRCRRCARHPRLLHDHDRAFGETGNLVRNRSQEQALELRKTAAAHNDRIDPRIVGIGDDGAGRFALAIYGLDLLEAVSFRLGPHIGDDALGGLVDR